MTHPWTWRRLGLPLGTLLAGLTLVGLECQYEPMPDQRRGYEGDKCAANNTCESGLICVLGESPPTCRKVCSPDVYPNCGACQEGERCSVVFTPDGGTPQGACVAGALEGQDCGNGCARCLLCAATGAGARGTCRRQCDLSIDAGPPQQAIIGEHPYCKSQPDHPETGAIVRQDCCLYGQSCTPVQMDPQTVGAVCFGPLPGDENGTCRPGRACNTTNLVCVPGNAALVTPDTCRRAGGRDQYCRTNATCDPNLVCLNDGEDRPKCRLRCDTSSTACAFCGDGYDCIQIDQEAPGRGACVFAAREGEDCSTRLCSQCLVCGGVAGADAGPKCRRTCLPDVDAGTPDAANVGPHDYCLQPDPDAGVIMRNCCPLGDACLTFIQGGGAACYER
jgi:hypothetical protein